MESPNKFLIYLSNFIKSKTDPPNMNQSLYWPNLLDLNSFSLGNNQLDTI